MGAYLSEPDTEKHSVNENLEHVNYGASSMQGWRVTQEDAHNCIPRFDDDTSLFAVYDGHGGAEVAQYCSMYLPDYIKSIGAFKNGNLAQALEDAFLGFDETLTHANVISELKHMTGVSDHPSDTENEVNHLCAEANMPLDEVLAKYQSVTSSGGETPPVNPILSRLKSKDDKPRSPFLRAKKGADTNNGNSSDLKPIVTELNEDGEKDDRELVNSISDSVAVKKQNTINAGSGNDSIGNGSLVSSPKEKNDDDEDSKITPIENEKGASADTVCVSSPSSGGQPGCSTGKRPRKTTNIVLEDDSEASSNSEDDVNYDGDIPYADSDSDEGGSSEEGLEGYDSGEDDDDDDDGEVDDDEEDEQEIDLSSEKEEPGSDSGCTAVVALLRGDELYVANAGDSRCIVCRNGKAIDMSVDHKPEDELEKQRIEKAGGEVTKDGRVNGGLNLSRAIGDHTYKQNRHLQAKEQMISALPDIRTLTIDPDEDEFMVLACDGIWNSMSSQEVADYVHEKLKNGSDQLSSICEALFDQCLATNTQGDGTGCDNMTAIVVKFNKELHKSVVSTVKRGGSAELVDQLEAKRIKTGDGESAD